MIVPANKPSDDFKFRVIVFLIVLNLVLLSLVAYICVHQSLFSQAVAFILAYVAVNAIFFALVIWLLNRIAEVNNRKRVARYSNRLRSPWGEKRTEEPKPYKDRLATFVSTSCETVQEGVFQPNDKLASTYEEPTVGDPMFRSRMSYWSAVDVPCEPEPPKPVWFIRRMLQRIRDALAGYR